MWHFGKMSSSRRYYAIHVQRLWQLPEGETNLHSNLQHRHKEPHKLFKKVALAKENIDVKSSSSQRVVPVQYSEREHEPEI